MSHIDAEATDAGQIHAELTCSQCGKDRCFCPPSDEEWVEAFGKVAEARARMRPRDSMPLVAYQSGWDK